jgi:Acetyltransferase (GNAT) domain
VMSPLAAAGLTVQSFAAARAGDWDDLVGRSCNGTFLHTRRFLSYHRDRFADRSLVLHDLRGRVTGVFPAAVSPADRETIVSHPGLTYGGLVHDGSVRGAAMIAALHEIAGHYRLLGYRRLRYKAVPAIYHSEPADDDLYALCRAGACLCRCDLSAAVHLGHRGHISHSRRQRRRRAEAAGASVEESWDDIAGFWQILEANLARRHGAVPVHSLEEINTLRRWFPRDILLISAKIGSTLVGGTILFSAGPVLHSQYTATSEEGRAVFAIDPIYEQAINLAAERGYRYFDFGTSTVDEGRSLNQDLYQFKVSFGAGGVTYDHYELDLRADTA